MSGYSASCDWEISKEHYEGKRYNCKSCYQSLSDHETYYNNGSIYCGCCYVSIEHTGHLV